MKKLFYKLVIKKCEEKDPDIFKEKETICFPQILVKSLSPLEVFFLLSIQHSIKNRTTPVLKKHFE